METNELKTYSSFNLYANGLIVDLLKDQPQQILEKEITSSFPSILKTVMHIWDAEYLWLERLNGISPAGFHSANFKGTAQDIFNNLLSTSKNFDDYVQKQDQASLSVLMPIRNTKGLPFTQTRYQMIHHCINHSTQHRGQLITMCRQVGITKFKPLDYIWYLRNRG